MGGGSRTIGLFSDAPIPSTTPTSRPDTEAAAPTDADAADGPVPFSVPFSPRSRPSQPSPAGPAEQSGARWAGPAATVRPPSGPGWWSLPLSRFPGRGGLDPLSLRP